MITALRKSTRTLKRVAAVFGCQVSAPKHSRLEVQGVPGTVEVAVITSAPVCLVCGVAAEIRDTADILDGKLAGECTACGALRRLD